MRKFAICAVVFFVSVILGACGKTPVADTTNNNECVVLLHGLARSSLSFERMRWFLEEQGYAVANIDYPSREHTIEALAPMAVEEGLRQCRDSGRAAKIHFVTHSLGGILVRQYFSEPRAVEPGRVVMLAPPNQGSNAVDALREVPGFEWLNGPAGFQLGKGPQSLPLKLGKPGFEFAVIAGDASIDPVTSAVLDDPDDGRVSVADTRLEGMSDFRLVDSSHAFIMQKNEVFELTLGFLATGKFPEPGTPD